MRIVYILAGAGGMYCGACNRDMELVTGIQKEGYDIELIPLYTPLRSDINTPSKMNPIFYGGILTFLEQKFKFFRHTPKIIDFFVDNPFLLKILSSFTIETKPQKLGPLTVSVLKGKEGNQQKELHKLISYLHTIKPDIVNITNSMLSGIAPTIKKEFNIPVVCSLQGEEEFLSSLGEIYYKEAQSLVRENAKSIDMFIATYAEYAREMTTFLHVPSQKITTISPGVNIEKYPLLMRSEVSLEMETQDVFRLGYLSRIAPEKGLDILLDAFIFLSKKYPKLELHVAGQIYDKKYWGKLQKIIHKSGVGKKIQYHGELTFKQKKDFLKKCHVFCVPSRFSESRGIAVLEAIATGIPVILPDIGIYSDIVYNTKAGLLVEPENIVDLHEKIETLIAHPDIIQTYRDNIRLNFAEKYNSQKMVHNIIKLYKKLVNTQQ